MAVLEKTILGDPTGTVNKVTFSTWKGKTVVKSLAKNVSDPNTILQQGARNKFRLLGTTLVPLSDVIKIGWNAYAKSGKKACTAQNAYMKYHLKDVDESVLFNGEFPEYTSINADKLLISRGSLGVATEAYYAGGSLNLVFPADYEKTNVAYAVLYNPTMMDMVYASAVTDSTNIAIKVTPRDDWEGDSTLYYFVTNAKGKKASNSSVVAQ